MQYTSAQGKVVWIVLAIIVLVVMVSGSIALGFYASRLANTSGSSTNGTSSVAQQMTMSQAVQTFKNYLGSLHNSNIALHEVEEYRYNFYASYYEKNSGTFAFQMLIWKSGSSYMMGMMGYTGTAGVAMPEMGPNMMWNTKYHASGGMMSEGMTSSGGMMGNYGQGTSTSMTIGGPQARGTAQQYLNHSMPGKMAGDTDTCYGYYNIDVLVNGSTFGMLSVNGYTGQVWYHTWHGDFIQTVTVG